MSGLKFIYGDYVHQAGEVLPRSLSMRTLQTSRNRRWATEYSMNVEGQLCSDISSPLTASTVNARISAMDDAYLHDYRDAGFLFDDDTPTAHYLRNDSGFNMTGNRVIQKSWLHQTPTEFANTRTFNITIWAQFLESYSDLLEFHERVEYIGNGGLDFEIRDQWAGPPTYEPLSESTSITAIQRGYTLGLLGYIEPPPPLFPAREKGKMRRRAYTTPRDHGHQIPNRFTGYRLDYAYYFKFETPNVLVATTRDQL